MNRRNYQRELEAVIKENESKSRVPRLLLHSCCAPCSSYVLEYLSDYLRSLYFIIIPIFLRLRNTKSVPQSSSI